MKKQSKTKGDVTRLMLSTLVSANLRIIIPVLVLFCVGFVVDINLSSKPWGMIIGASLGIIIATVLIVLQLRGIRAESAITHEDENGN